MRILGVDPGIATVGFAVLDADKRSQRLLTCGVITTPAKTQLSSRLDQIYRDLNELIAQFHPEAMAVEELFFNTNITTGIAVAHGRGIILLSGYQAGLQIYEYTPLQVKQAVVGYGRAEKAGHGYGAAHPVPAGSPEAGRRGGRRCHRAVSRTQRYIIDPSTGEV